VLAPSQWRSDCCSPTLRTWRLRICRRCLHDYSRPLKSLKPLLQAVAPGSVRDRAEGAGGETWLPCSGLHLLLERPQARAGWFAAPFFLRRARRFRGGAATLSVTASSGRLDDSVEAGFSRQLDGQRFCRSCCQQQAPRATAVCIPLALRVAQKAPVGRPAATCQAGWSRWRLRRAQISARSNQISDACGRLESGAGQPDRGCQHSVAVGLDSRPLPAQPERGLETLLSTPAGPGRPAQGSESRVRARPQSRPQFDRICRLERAVSILLHGAQVVRHSSVHGALTPGRVRGLPAAAGVRTGRLVPPACIRQAISRTGRLWCRPGIRPSQLLEALIRLDAGDSEMGSDRSAASDSELADQCVLKHSLDSVNVDSSLSARTRSSCLERLLMMPANSALKDLKIRAGAVQRRSPSSYSLTALFTASSSCFCLACCTILLGALGQHVSCQIVIVELHVQQKKVAQRLRREALLLQQELEALKSAGSVGLHVHQAEVVQRDGVQLFLASRRHVGQGVLGLGDVGGFVQSQRVTDAAHLRVVIGYHANAELWMIPDAFLDDICDELQCLGVLPHLVVADGDVSSLVETLRKVQLVLWRLRAKLSQPLVRIASGNEVLHLVEAVAEE
uniref:Kinesin motor domain-containing protein n=1 Tax=Macrostomum lignano TaxID=282301 RepID=A0A1I8IGP2_9PLAT